MGVSRPHGHKASLSDGHIVHRAMMEPDVPLGPGLHHFRHPLQGAHAHQLLPLDEVLDIHIAAVGLRRFIGRLGLVGHDVGEHLVSVDLAPAIRQSGKIRFSQEIQCLCKPGAQVSVLVLVLQRIIDHGSSLLFYGQHTPRMCICKAEDGSCRPPLLLFDALLAQSLTSMTRTTPSET